MTGQRAYLSSSLRQLTGVQLKQKSQMKHNMAKSPDRWDADQLATYSTAEGSKNLGLPRNKFWKCSEWVTNSGAMDSGSPTPQSLGDAASR